MILTKSRLSRHALVCSLFATILLASPVHAAVSSTASGESVDTIPERAVITSVDKSTVDQQPKTVYKVRFLSGKNKGTTVTIGDLEQVTTLNGKEFQKGDVIYVSSIQHFDGTTRYLINDYDRRAGLWWLAALFLLVIIWFSRWHGLRSVMGLIFSFVVIIGWMVPQIAAGNNPVTISLLGSAAVLIVGFLITEGFSRLTWASILGTVITMAVIGLLSNWSIGLTHLTGNSSEEAFYLQGQGSETIDLRGLLLAGIIIGTLGILEDVAVSQVATIGELRHANPKQSGWMLYQAGIRVGRSHLAAIINTLTLAYAGSALPLLLLFHIGGQNQTQIINGEIVATEIVRTIVGSIGLILALPITTACAVLLKVNSSGGGHSHSHVVPEADVVLPRQRILK